MQTHERFMQEALDLAKKGWPNVAPNPLVGCVIVCEKEVVASGYHESYGEPHAEVIAVRRLPASAKPADCTLYVTLEPCNHYGKTPPCTDLILDKGFKKVVISCLDPNPLVAGKGVNRLREAGVQVIVGVLEKQARFMNRRFFCFHEKKRPYLILKWAQTADGFISRYPVPSNKSENHISGPEADLFVHQLRSECQAIMVGKNTVMADNPHLTTRLVTGRNTRRIIIDRHLEIPPHYHVFEQEAPTTVFNTKKQEKIGQISFLKIDFQSDIMPQILGILHSEGIQSLLVEGGSVLANSLLRASLWDEAFIIQNPDLKFGTGVTAPKLKPGSPSKHLGKDLLFNTFSEHWL